MSLFPRYRVCLSLFAALFLLTPVTAAERPLKYQTDIQPIFETKCLACHGCYDAPCQLKLEAPEGLDRGASKNKVYNGVRTESVPPTRLFEDASPQCSFSRFSLHRLPHKRSHFAPTQID